MAVNPLDETGAGAAPRTAANAETPVSAPAARRQARRERPPADWQALTRFDLYRLFLSLALLVGLPFLPTLVPMQANFAYLTTAGMYGLGAALSLLLVHLRWPAYPLQILLRWAVDVVALSLLLVYAGGVGSGLEVLLVANVAALSLLLPARPALGVAASAALSALGITFWLGPQSATVYYQSALLGVSLFAVAALGSTLGQRARQSEALAEQRREDLLNLAQLNDYIIQRIDAGIVVVDARLRVRLMNESAWFLFGNPVRRGHGMPLRALDATLADLLEAWRSDPDQVVVLPLSLPGSSRTYQPRFTPLGQDGRLGALIFLEDVSAVRKRAQDLKLSSLGRLAMSIAHEVRNPLGAISHAAQLLEESPRLDEGDRRLLAIIRQQSRRMNEIIESVMDLSRRGRAQPRRIQLGPWLRQFREEFARAHEGVEISAQVDPEDTVAWMDPGHLQQVMVNLCENAVKYGTAPNGRRWVGIRAGRTRESRGPFLEVVDKGPGVNPEDRAHLFEPFYTTRAQGTGLGLYIARELCEANQARLEYVPIPTGGSCFRITFREPKDKGA